jgi:uncharacterized membrane protein
MSEQVTRTIIVKSEVDSVYQLWANFENFPHFMQNIKSVKKTGENTSEWTMAGPMGTKVKWDAEMTRKEENKRIAWSSKDRKGTITTSGQVTFNPLPDDETEITVVLQYKAPAGKLGEAAAKLLTNPKARLEEDLRNFKAFAEGMYDRTPR